MRVPTYATYMNMTNATIANKQLVDKYSFQSITGLKAQNYSGYGMSASSIVSLEATLGVTNTFLDNNKITEVEIKTMNTSMEAIQKTINDFKSILTSFSGLTGEGVAQNGASSLTPDYTGGEIVFTNNNVADYMGKTITINGTQYTFADNGNGNNINLKNAHNAEEVMQALQNKLPVNADFKFEGNKFTFPLYTINGASDVLNVSGVQTGEPYMMNSDQARELRQLQNSAFASLKMMVDSLNTFANGKYLFGGGVSNQAPVDFPFATLDEFQAYYDGVNIAYPETASAQLSNFTVDASSSGDLTFALDGTHSNFGTISAEKTGGFLKQAITANDKTTGDLTFNSDKNTLNATEYGAFNTFSAGDTIVVGGNASGNNAKAYIVKSISADGKTITFDESTPVVTDDVISPNNDVSFSKSFPVGAIINLDGFNNNNLAGQVRVIGVSDDGSELRVAVDPSRFPNMTVAASSSWSLSGQSYYKGGDLSSEKRVSENQSINFDVNAKDPAFEKIFRALGIIAQGNLVDTRNPANDMTGTIAVSNPIDRVNEALDLISEALFNATDNAKVKNADIYTVTAKINSNYVVVNQTATNQQAVKANLENNISSLKNVDKTEAATKLLLASQNLEASYTVLQQAMRLSLLDYMK